jgi:hypothetical protein
VSETPAFTAPRIALLLLLGGAAFAVGHHQASRGAPPPAAKAAARMEPPSAEVLRIRAAREAREVASMQSALAAVQATGDEQALVREALARFQSQRRELQRPIGAHPAPGEMVELSRRSSAVRRDRDESIRTILGPERGQKYLEAERAETWRERTRGRGPDGGSVLR